MISPRVHARICSIAWRGRESDGCTGDGGTGLSLTFRAVGLLNPDIAHKFRDGWRELVTVRLEAFIETGTRLGIDPG